MLPPLTPSKGSQYGVANFSLTEADVDAYVAIWHAAFEGGLNRIFFTTGRFLTRENREIAAYTLKSLREDPTIEVPKGH